MFELLIELFSFTQMRGEVARFPYTKICESRRRFVMSVFPTINGSERNA